MKVTKKIMVIISLLIVISSVFSKPILTHALSNGVKNIVARAKQQVNIEWTPVKNVNGYKNTSGTLTKVFYAGTTYKGLPYGLGSNYIPFDSSFDTFLNAVKNSNSVFYTSRNKYTYNGKATESTYYATDCSAFVSYAYGIGRTTTTGLFSKASSGELSYVSGNSIYNAQVGDCLNRSDHVKLITGLNYNSSGALVSVEISESTPPICKTETYSVASVASDLNNGYKLLRYNKRDSVPAPTSYTGYNDGNHNPIGSLDNLTGGNGQVYVSGWAFDPDKTSDSITVHVYVGGPAGSSGAKCFPMTANKERNDVNKAYGITGKHGYSGWIDCPTLIGEKEVYIYGINVGAGGNAQIANGKTKITGNNPQGVFDVCQNDNGAVRIKGWAFDADEPTSSINCKVYIGSTNNTPITITTSVEREDVNKTYSLTGNHGYDVSIPTELRGNQTVYVYAINKKGGKDVLIGKKEINILDSASSGLQVAQGDYRIVTKLIEKGLDIQSASKEKWANVQIYSNLNDKTQTFNIFKEKDGFYTIKVNNSGHVLAIEGGGEKSNVIQNEYYDTKDYQRWMFKKSDDGYINIISKYNGKYLEVIDVSRDDGANVIVNTYSGYNRQKWLLRRILKNNMISVDTSNLKYDGTEQKPEVTVTVDGVVLKENVDYTLNYSNNTGVGTGQVTVTGMGDYCDSVTKSFSIDKNTVKLDTSITDTDLHVGENSYLTIDCERDYNNF